MTDNIDLFYSVFTYSWPGSTNTHSFHLGYGQTLRKTSQNILGQGKIRQITIKHWQALVKRERKVLFSVQLELSDGPPVVGQ